MAGYQRRTALAPHEVFEKAEEVLPKLLAGMMRSGGSGHSATYDGPEGVIELTAHRHGPYTSVVASTNKLRTSRLDYEVQRFLNRLPYEPGDEGGPGSGDPRP